MKNKKNSDVKIAISNKNGEYEMYVNEEGLLNFFKSLDFNMNDSKGEDYNPYIALKEKLKIKKQINYEPFLSIGLLHPFEIKNGKYSESYIVDFVINEKEISLRRKRMPKSKADNSRFNERITIKRIKP